jgi:tetratricopeptide (TPR) repeat protein
MKSFKVCLPDLRGTIFLAGALLLASGLPAQDFDLQSDGLHGRLQARSGSLPQHLVIQVQGSGGYVLGTTDVQPDGKFAVAVRDAKPGSLYQLQILEGVHGNIIHRESVPWPPMQPSLDIEIFAAEQSRPVSGFVTVNQLHQDPPRKARKQLARALKAERAGDLKKSIEYVREALATYPEYIDASYQLGALYLKLSDFAQAEQAFQQTLGLDARHPLAYCGLSLSRSGAGRSTEGEEAAREALRLHPSLAWAHYALGIALLGRNTGPGEVETPLRRAAGEIPLARLVLARVLEQQGHKQEAAGELKSYLDSGAPGNRQAASRWLKKLRGE